MLPKRSPKDVVLQQIHLEKWYCGEVVREIEKDISGHRHAALCAVFCQRMAKQKALQKAHAELMQWECFEEIIKYGNLKESVHALDQVIAKWKTPWWKRLLLGLYGIADRHAIGVVWDLDRVRSRARDLRFTFIQEIPKQHSPPPFV